MLSNQQSISSYMKEENRLLTVLAFACIYFVWGSTYLAISYAVETIPPLFVASSRHLIAGSLLFAWCWWRGLRPTRQQWLASIVLGVLFFVIGHGTLHWAQQTLPSGVAAILIATEPIFVAIILASTRRTRITMTLLIGLLLGLFGVALIMGADFQTGRSQMLSSLAVLIGTVSWSIGMVYSRSAALHPDDRMAAAMSLLAGAVMLFVTGTVAGEAAEFDLALVSVKSLAALGYLAIAGSLVAYSAYFWLLNRFPPTLVATHTYVNPVVALVLGWSIAGEVITGRFLFGGVVVIAAIVLVGRATSRVGQETKISEQLSHAPATEQKAALPQKI
ncbi:MAG TPA: EamA family transporter [Pyrinomonadaceae bacterium]|nr:EamA family transporter [Pyrinomonadaceae bacterium]